MKCWSGCRILIAGGIFDHGETGKNGSSVVGASFIYKVKQALLLKDTEWLGRMSYLLKNKKFYDALSEDKKYQKIMRRYYESYWGELKY